MTDHAARVREAKMMVDSMHAEFMRVGRETGASEQTIQQCEREYAHWRDILIAAAEAKGRAEAEESCRKLRDRDAEIRAVAMAEAVRHARAEAVAESVRVVEGMTPHLQVDANYPSGRDVLTVHEVIAALADLLRQSDTP